MKVFSDHDEELRFTEPREGRILFGFFFISFGAMGVFIGTIEEAGFLFLIGMVLLFIGVYASLCVSVMTIDFTRKEVTYGKSCVLFSNKKVLSFRTFREVGIRVAHYSDVIEGGVYYTLELRTPSNIVVPGTKTQDESRAIALAEKISQCMGIRFNSTYRKIFTGQWVLDSQERQR